MAHISFPSEDRVGLVVRTHISGVESGREAGGVRKIPARSYSDLLTFVEHSGDHS